MTDVVLTRRPFPQAIRMALGLPETADDTEVVVAASMAYQLAALAEASARADAEAAAEPEPELTHIADLAHPEAHAALARLTSGPRPGHACTPPVDAPMGARWTCECQQPWKVTRGAWAPA